MKYFNSINSYSIFLIASLLISCTSNKNVVTEQSENVQIDLIKETIENNFNNSDSLYVIPNDKETLVLYLSEKMKTSVNPVNSINFFVFDKSTNEIIYQNKFSNSEISWYNNEELLLKKYLGYIENVDSKGFTFSKINVITKEIIEINNSNTNKP